VTRGDFERRGSGRAPRFVDPFIALSATRAWRADDAIDNGLVTTSIPAYVGSAMPLLAFGTGQSIKAPASELGGRRAIACDGLAASDGYGAVTFGAVPAALTIASVAYVSSAAATQGIAASTVGAGALTGCAQAYSVGAAGIRSRKLSAADVVGLAPRAFVVVTVFTATQTINYVNSLTPVTVADATPLAGTTFNLACLADGSSVLSGKLARAGYWERALSTAEVTLTLLQLGAHHKIQVAA
jgi:hypothetical protein